MTLSKVTIIIPCYNIGIHISKCIESILSQTFNEFELLLLDDGSTDDTLQIAEIYALKDDRIIVNSHTNQGVSFTRNRGIHLATAQLLIFIDGDDYVEFDFVEKLVANYSEGHWPISGMINTRKGVQVKNEKFENLLKKHAACEFSTNNVFELLKQGAIGSPCARVYSKKIINNNSIYFKENITYQEDLIFDLEYLKYVKRINLIDYFGYYYVEHENSSTSRFHENFNQITQIYVILQSFIKTDQDKIFLKEFLLQTTLRKISNIFHCNSIRSEKEKLKELIVTLNSDYFDYSRVYIKNLKINRLLKYVLNSKSALLIYGYFKLFNYIKIYKPK